MEFEVWDKEIPNEVYLLGQIIANRVLQDKRIFELLEKYREDPDVDETLHEMVEDAVMSITGDEDIAIWHDVDSEETTFVLEVEYEGRKYYVILDLDCRQHFVSKEANYGFDWPSIRLEKKRVRMKHCVHSK